MPPRVWYQRGIRLIGRTAVECTRDALAHRIGVDVASVAACMGLNELLILDPFAGSCNTLFWILRHLPKSKGIAFESDPNVFELTRQNLAVLGHTIELLLGDYFSLVKQPRPPNDRGIVAFVAPPWGRALDEVHGLDLCNTLPPISAVIEHIAEQFPKTRLLFAIQVYEKVSPASTAEIQKLLDWTELHIYDINEKGRNHGILLGAKAWIPHRLRSMVQAEQ